MIMMMMVLSKHVSLNVKVNKSDAPSPKAYSNTLNPKMQNVD